MVGNGHRELLDDTSKAIIKQLQEDGRRSYAAIGKSVGLSEAATRQRVAKLVEGGVMQIVAVTDPTQLGFDRQAMIAITATGDLEELASKLEAIPEVEYIVITAGSFDLMVEVVARDDDHILHIVNDRIRTLDGVIRTESFLYLKLVKQTYNWGAG
jgi:Lrp/AsnC family transcriptional regulator for asnA, asnC and gidA